jgi:multimeric flavodoxin WrbA
MVETFVNGVGQRTQINIATRSAAAASAADLLAADALIIATPENFGYMAGAVKDFFDRVFYRCMLDSTATSGGTQSLLAGRPYSVLVCAGSDGSGAMQSVDRIITGWRMRKAHPGIIARRAGGQAGASSGALSSDDLVACHELGQLFAEGLEIGAL